MNIFCAGCAAEVDARLTDGGEIYPHRGDLAGLPFWKCDACGNYVGCHHKTKDRTRPLGRIPTVEVRRARRHCHEVFDPLWQRAETMYRIEESPGAPEHDRAVQRIRATARRRAYEYIADSLGIPEPDAHMGTQIDIGILRGIYAAARDATPETIREWAKKRRAAA